MRPEPLPVRPGQESVWDYPRPPRLELAGAHVVVQVDGVTIADTRRAHRVLETSHPPTWYLPPADCDEAVFRRATGSSFCEWKGVAEYWDVVVGDRVIERAVWSYPDPTSAFVAVADHRAFYASVFECFVDGERAEPQPGGFYGGWVTSNLVGPFKGGPGSHGW